MFTNVNMKKIVLWLFIIMVCTFAVSGAIQLTNGFNGTILSYGDYAGSKATTPVDISKSFSMGGIKNIRVNTVSEDVNVIPSDSNEIKVRLYGRRDDSVALNTDQAGDNLDIKVEHKVIFGIHLSDINLKLDVYIPKAYAESLNVSTVSAKLDISNLNLNDFKFNSVSGGLTASGVGTTNTDINTTSGSMDIGGFSGNLDFSSVSGDLDVKYNSYDNNNIKINTTSGRSKVKLPEKSQFDIRFMSTSGKFESTFPITTAGSGEGHNISGTVGAGGGNITANSVSGDLEIYK